MFRADTASISDTADRFARAVAPAYIHNNWLGSEDKSFEEVVSSIRDTAISLYIDVLSSARKRDFEGPYTFVSTGRVMVILFDWEDGPEIQFLLDVETELKDEDGVWHHISYWDEDAA